MTVIQEDRETLCCRIVNQFLFDKVWNEVFSEYRNNIKPHLLFNKSVYGSFGVIDATMYLPTKESYFVWTTPINNTHLGLKLKTDKWYSLVEIQNDFHTTFNIFGPQGQMLSKGSTYVRYNLSRTNMFIVAKKDMVNKSMPLKDIDSVFMTLYYNHHTYQQCTVHSVYVDNSYALEAYQRGIDEFLANCTESKWLLEYKNGVEITDPDNTPELELGCYYDFIIDKNIDFIFDYDITTSSENPVYLSEQDNTWKQLVHIPKELNPLNKVITHNTCDFFVRKTYPQNANVEGLYLHRISTTNRRTVNQITHNDFGIPLYVLDNYRDTLDTQEITLRVIVRLHEKDNILIREASYLDLLYSPIHSDENIVKFLTGKADTPIEFWKAAKLEQTDYVKMFWNTPNLTYDNTQKTYLKKYIETLGYYQVVNLLCPRIQDTKVTNTFTGKYSVNIPLIYTGLKVFPVVYLNGKVLLNHQFTYSVSESEHKIYISLTGLITTQGDEITTIIYLKQDGSLSFTPQDGNSRLAIDFDDYTVYKEVTVSRTSKIKGVNTTTDIAYEVLPADSNLFAEIKYQDGHKELSFRSDLINTNILVQNNKLTKVIERDLAHFTSTGSSIAFKLEDENHLPLLTFKNIAVYLNGYYLVKGIDYFVNDVTDLVGNLAFRELVIQTMDYFNETGEDRVKIILNIAETEEISTGFSVDDQVFDSTPINLNFPAITTLHVNGLLERHAEYQGTFYQLPTGKYENGAVFELQTSIPAIVNDYLKQFKSNTELARIQQLNKYFYDKVPQMPEILELTSKHRIYSTMMNNFINDIVKGVIETVNDPDEVRMKAQILPYWYLNNMDIVFKKLDQKFVDFYPQYVNYEVTPAMKHFIDKFIAAFMPANQDPTVEVVYGE